MHKIRNEKLIQIFFLGKNLICKDFKLFEFVENFVTKTSKWQFKSKNLSEKNFDWIQFDKTALKYNFSNTWLVLNNI